MLDHLEKIRLYVQIAHLEEGQIVALNPKQAHYLHHVMRLHTGNLVRIFNGIDGEWRACLVSLGKNGGDLKVTKHIKPMACLPEIHLYFPPLKHGPLHFLLEKTTELGLTHFHPILTQLTAVRGFNIEKARTITIEAAEQCGRIDIPLMKELTLLKENLSLFHQSPTPLLYVCDERRQAPPLVQLSKNHPQGAPYAFLIGPEGGFSDEEFDFLQQLSFVRFLTLSSNILRAETAGVAALSQASGLLIK
jgi:16S rRNA (uracil1498-N3)-methyltransferase